MSKDMMKRPPDMGDALFWMLTIMALAAFIVGSGVLVFVELFR